MSLFSRCSETIKNDLRFSLYPHILAALGLLALTPVIFGISALDAAAAAYPLELCLPFAGIILLTPVFSPESEPSVLDAVRARKASYTLTCGVRLIAMEIITVLGIYAFAALMRATESEVTAAHCFGSCANAVFLGGLGALAAALSGSAVIGYMVPVLYYVIDLMGGLGEFPLTLFSMMRAGGTGNKALLLAAGICVMLGALGVRQIKK
ncbi:MAG: hypothetical protein LBS19_04935 [Clostridiales bacterium]|jgi:hypothetical protein|nr:hypothetical protein [Clostridiales bacterium]